MKRIVYVVFIGTLTTAKDQIQVRISRLQTPDLEYVPLSIRKYKEL